MGYGETKQECGQYLRGVVTLEGTQNHQLYHLEVRDLSFCTLC